MPLSSSRLRTILTPDRLGWVGVCAFVLGASLISNWLQSPLAEQRQFPFLWIAAPLWAGGWLLTRDKVEAWLGRFNLDGTGAWLTTRAERLRRLTALPFCAVAVLELGLIGWALWRLGDAPRLAVSAAIVLALLVFMIVFIWRTWRVRLELRIDAAGVFAPAWRRAYGWDEIAFAVQPNGGRDLRLVLTPEAAEKHGCAALLTTPLGPTGLQANEALAALRTTRPDLPIRPWTSNGVVLPIRGATDVPDTVEVTTYG
ncbi:hypothetical protein [Caulobacter segnis]|uniref:Uncharacterized protein n=1 Tax=Caulobacter segnis TaxID=88688 RepID=A0A2W5VPZ5_9CAUL|nr:hypothetical protein [Caulobacter segnis]PZR37385.1 MAG: hypothetical protein DI526_00360 [Caulobacter segnis]